jgi:hypothetical protein
VKGVSAAALGTVQYVSTPVPIAAEARSGSSGAVACPAGMKVIGGGAMVSDPTVAYVNESAPTVDRGGWFADAYSPVPGVAMTITAICTPVTVPVG